MTRSSRQTLSWVGLLVGLFVIIIALLMAGRPDSGGGVAGEPSTVEAAVDNVKGPADAPVTIVEYSDFECPFCAQFASSVTTQLQQDFGDDVNFVYRHFPLVSIHRNALPAAQLSEAAALQGKFWEVHDAIFATQSVWSRTPQSPESFAEMLQAAGVELDYEKLLDDVDSKEVKDRVQRDRRDATRLGLTGTPTVFVNGQLVPNATNYAALSAAIQAALTQAQ